MLPLGQPTCLTIPLEGRSPFQMNVTGKAGGNVMEKSWGSNAGRFPQGNAWPMPLNVAGQVVDSV